MPDFPCIVLTRVPTRWTLEAELHCIVSVSEVVWRTHNSYVSRQICECEALFPVSQKVTKYF